MSTTISKRFKVRYRRLSARQPSKIVLSLNSLKLLLFNLMINKKDRFSLKSILLILVQIVSICLSLGNKLQEFIKKIKFGKIYLSYRPLEDRLSS